MIELFHGGCSRFDCINLDECRNHRDFGKGFYLTPNQEHAMERAVFKGRIYGKHPVVMNFIFDDDAATTNGLKILDFGNGGQEWAEFVFNNREEENYTSDWDIVIGPIADDGLRDKLLKVKRGELPVAQLSTEIKYYQITKQYCFRTEQSLKYLKKRL